MIKFLRDTLPKEGGSFIAGEVLDASSASEERWIKRGAAEVFVQVEKPTPKPKAKRPAKYKGK